MTNYRERLIFSEKHAILQGKFIVYFLCPSCRNCKQCFITHTHKTILFFKSILWNYANNNHSNDSSRKSSNLTVISVKSIKQYWDLFTDRQVFSFYSDNSIIIFPLEPQKITSGFPDCPWPVSCSNKELNHAWWKESWEGTMGCCTAGMSLQPTRITGTRETPASIWSEKEETEN